MISYDPNKTAYFRWTLPNGALEIIYPRSVPASEIGDMMAILDLAKKQIRVLHDFKDPPRAEGMRPASELAFELEAIAASEVISASARDALKESASRLRADQKLRQYALRDARRKACAAFACRIMAFGEKCGGRISAGWKGDTDDMPTEVTLTVFNRDGSAFGLLDTTDLDKPTIVADPPQHAGAAT